MFWIKMIGRVLLTVFLGVTLIAFVIIIAAIVLWGIVHFFAQDACDVDRLKQASDQMKAVVFSCGEFWINRYQSLVGNVLPATAAFVTLIWIAAQLGATKRQSAAAGAAALRARVIDLVDAARLIDQASTQITAAQPLVSEYEASIFDGGPKSIRYQRITEGDETIGPRNAAIRAQIRQVGHAFASVANMKLIPASSPLWAKADRCSANAFLALREFAEAEAKIILNTGSLAADAKAEIRALTAAQFPQLMANIASLSDVQMQMAQLIATQIDRTWTRIRALESDAVG